MFTLPAHMKHIVFYFDLPILLIHCSQTDLKNKPYIYIYIYI